MPIMDGLECVKRFRKFEGEQPQETYERDNLIIIGCSANSDDATHTAALSAGIVYLYFMKYTCNLAVIIRVRTNGVIICFTDYMYILLLYIIFHCVIHVLIIYVLYSILYTVYIRHERVYRQAPEPQVPRQLIAQIRTISLTETSLYTHRV